MKPHLRGALILATVLAMALTYLGGALVSAQTGAITAGPQAPAITTAQWAAVQAANLLLLDGDSDPVTYLPLTLK